MNGVIVEAGEALNAVVEAIGFEPGIDEAFWRIALRGLLTSSEALEGEGLAIGRKDAPIRGDALNNRRAAAPVSDRLWLSHADGGRHALLGGNAKIHWREQSSTTRGQKCCRRAIVARRIVLVHGLDGDAMWAGASGEGEAFTPCVVRSASDAQPIDSAEHDGLLASGVEHDAASQQWRGYLRRRDDERITEGRADGRCHVSLEGRNAQSGLRGKGRRGKE